ncbi:glycosyltransferase family 1 protein [Paenibacillus sabinae]|uniref:Group 1 glycosyl transferase n=1 Tax=Paenibacillus sabinae T27 TaxID=1268072 RepID=X4ZGD4_9BACL|nr:glycosyltransferase family 1 protein [Paenibacillus sabinae]AHV98591.1 group 1 glycosyl transferase [Paenibacillus sabinae T27]
MKILFCGMDKNLGGIESFVINMYRNLDNSKVQVDFLKITDSIYYEEELIKNGSKVYKIPNRRSNPLLFYYELFNFFRNHKEYQIVHHHLNSCSSIEPIIIAKLFGRRTIAHSHNVFKGNKIISRILHSINKYILPFFSDLNISCSNAAGISMFRNKPFIVINNGINAQDYCFDSKVRALYRDELDLTDKFVIGHIGRFKYQKNHEFLIDIFNEVYQKNQKSVLLLIGDGELRSKIEKKISELSLSNNVIFAGIRSDIPQLLQAMDVFVFPSRYEGSPIALIEAQAAGLFSFVASTISKESYITNMVKSIQLENNSKEWAEQILSSMKNYERINTLEVIKSKGFDCVASAKLLQQIYLD